MNLKSDLTILEAMVAEMPDYLRSDVLFWRMMKGGMPMLTLGGYLMRQHRLQALADLLLNEEEQERVDAAVLTFNTITQEKIVRLEEKAHKELEARIRQWGESLREIKNVSVSYYQTAVETRAMIAALINKLQTKPYELQPRFVSQVNLLDGNLRNNWQSGDFIWPPEWEPAYPRLNYWWLYGRPK